MIGSELIAELDGSYNLSTSPFTVSNLQGDLYNYHFIVFVDSASATSGSLDITLNSDTGTNYNRYRMYGNASTANASISSADTKYRFTNFTRTQSNRNALAIGSLTGSSGDNRKLSTLHSDGYAPEIQFVDGYWTNTVDEVTSMTFTGTASASYTWHIMVYRTPKESVQGSWEYMKELSWSSETAEKSFSSLDGDTDIQYMIQWDGDKFIDVELNNDGTTANYQRQWLYNNGGTLTAGTATDLPFIKEQGNLLINAESGVDRLIYQDGSHTSGTVQNKATMWWQNTADNLTSIDITPSSSATGTAKLYRRINPNITADVFPFETIKTFDVSGDYTTGDTLSGLTCDDYKMIKIEWLGANTSGNTGVYVEFNGDTGSNYYEQNLIGDTSAASAVANSRTRILIGNPQNADQAHGVIYFYPKSGEYRPSLGTYLYDENAIRFHADWWLNSADEITSIKTYANNTNSLTGQIRISVLR